MRTDERFGQAFNGKGGCLVFSERSKRNVDTHDFFFLYVHTDALYSIMRILVSCPD